MSGQDLELLVTMDDPGEDDLGEDTFHQATEKNGRPIHTNDYSSAEKAD